MIFLRDIAIIIYIYISKEGGNLNILSASDFFSKIFDWFANLSSKLPAIDYKTYFIAVVTLLIGIGVVVALTFLGSYRFKLLVACKKIIRYLSDVDAVDNDNFGDFTAQCFSAKAPSALRDCWVQYLGVRFGYPSDIVSEQNVYDKQVKRVREIRANIFIAIALILIAIFSFWGYGRLDGKDMGVIFLAGLLLSGVIYLVLVILNKMLSTKCLYVFNNMQEDLDAKVVFQVEKSFATDSSPLADLSAIIDEIVARNTAKEIGFEFSDEQTPIEELIAQTADGVDDYDAFDSVEIKTETSAEPEVTEQNADKVETAEAIEAEAVKTEETEGEGNTESKNEENVSIDDILAQDEKTETVEEEPAKENEDSFNAETVEIEPTVDASNDAIDGVVDDVTSSEEVKESEAEKQAVDGVTFEDEPIIVVEEPQDIDEKTEVEIIDEEVTREDSKEGDEQKKNNVDESSDNTNETSYVEDVTAEADARQATVEPIGPTDEDKAETLDETVDNVEIKPENSDEQGGDESEPVVRYVMDGPTDDDELIKPARLVKMPNLVDYILSQNTSAKVKMNLANMLMASYKKFESSDEDKKIIQDCVKKLMADLQKNNK